MRPLSEWSESTDPFFQSRSVVAFDLDDTLTTRGALPGDVVRDLEAAQARGWRTCLVTGRSAGWVDALIKLLPFDAVVGENGALVVDWPAGKARRGEREAPRKLYWTPQGYGDQPPPGLRDRMEATLADVRKNVPGCQVASDQAFRIYDLAVDFAEEVDPPLDLAAADRIREVFEAHGATAKVSSIHVNGWWGTFNKTDGLRRLVEGHWGLTLERAVVYVGDSPNDGPLFGAAGVSVGVANLRHFVGRVDFTPPTYVARGEASQGARELLARLGTRP